MARQADREEPAEGTPPAAAPAGEETRWPTWDDIARLHQIPGVDGTIPEPMPAPEPLPTPEPLPGPEPLPAPEPVPAPEPLPQPEPLPSPVPMTGSAAEGDRLPEQTPASAPTADEATSDESLPDEAAVARPPAGETSPDGVASGEPGVEGTVVAELSGDDVAPDDVTSGDEPVDEVAPTDVAPGNERVDEVAVEDVTAAEQAAELVPAAATVVVPRVTGSEADPDATVVVPALTVRELDPPTDPDATVVMPAAGLAPQRMSVLEPAAPARVSVFPATSTPAAEGARIVAGPVPTQRTAEREPSMLDAFPERESRRRWPLRLAVGAGVLVVLAGAYVGMSYALRDKVPHGATVAGVQIGGLTSSDAVQRLTTQLADATGKPLTVTAHDVQGQIDPASAGLTFDPRATVDSLTGLRLGDPRWLWRQIVGIGDVRPVTSVDRSALTTALEGLSGTLSADAVDGAIVFVDGSPHATPAQDGWKVDEQAAVQRIASTWLVAARPLQLPTAIVPPAVSQEATDRALADVAQHVSGGPVSVTVGDQTATLPAPTLAANASFVPQDGALVLQMNGKALTDALVAQMPGLLTPAADAHFEFQNDAPVIVPGQPGTTLDPVQVAMAVGAAASKATDRTATLQMTPTDPTQSTAALQALGVNEIVSEFDTPLTSDHIRDINIRQGAARVSGVLVRPGETFSLTDSLRPIDAAHGFVAAGAIVDGQHVAAMGGGLSQLSTTTYNAAYFAGFEIVEHTPHSEWFSRYPEGREATLFTGVIDLKWKNNTPYGALVQAWIGTDDHLHVRIWGTKYWTVQSTTSARSNVQQPTTLYDQSPTCVPAGKGNPGFTVSVTRKVFLGTQLSSQSTFRTTYKPQNQVICGPAPAPAPGP